MVIRKIQLALFCNKIANSKSLLSKEVLISSVISVTAILFFFIYSHWLLSYKIVMKVECELKTMQREKELLFTLAFPQSKINFIKTYKKQSAHGYNNNE
jgi:hypothetical protein